MRVRKLRRLLLMASAIILLASPIWSASLDVSWTANTEVDLAGYEVFDNGILVGTIGVMAAPLYTIANIGQGLHSVQVDAYDNAVPPNYSPKSTPATITVNTVPPGTPTGLKLLLK